MPRLPTWTKFSIIIPRQGAALVCLRQTWNYSNFWLFIFHQYHVKMAPSTGWSVLLLLIVISLYNQNHQQFDLDSDSEIDLEVSENNNHDFLGTH